MVIVNMVIMMIISNQRNYNSYDNIKNNILNLPYIIYIGLTL